MQTAAALATPANDLAPAAALDGAAGMGLPLRLQLSRERGFNLQALSRRTNGRGCVPVDRKTPWGNPYVVLKEGPFCYSVNGDGDFATREAATKEAVAKHAIDCERIKPRIQSHLRGVNLACWCAIGEPCHADTLLRIANE